MIFLLKFIHMIALFLGGGASLGNAILGARAEALDGPPPPLVPQAMATFRKTGLVAIALFWISGVGLVALKYGTWALGPAFYLKLALAAVTTVLLLALTWLPMAAARAGTPPDRARLKRIASWLRLSVLLTIAVAVFVFGIAR
ncbi:hypothetical protein [Oceanomicrobium pacificus]|uniref:DUF2269 family protein n=1 Tax=Oceanomicrobium pacificus TaxID=2692916 RepID=A0A6B0TYS8_9RHOB|nr:hypothetical protein [Oceanomicrobium pacificus]MXU66845.1 hypothetical protein [Oceanomicrobium pacificus]